MDLRQKILIVDDKEENLYALEHVLKDMNVSIVKATNGNDALIAVLNHDFSMAILDVQMPEMDGYELAEYIRSEEKTKYLPVIFLSAVYSDDFHVFKGYQSGAVDFITKPFNPEILINKVKVFLELDWQKLQLHNHKTQLEEVIRELNKSNEELKKQISERKIAETLLKKSEKKLKELNATKDKFFSIVAHDLKNPFNTLIGFSELLMKNAGIIDEEKKHHFYRLIYNASKQGYNLLANLLEWSRSQTGRIKLSPLRIQLKSIIDENLELMTSTAEKKEIEIITKVDSGLYVFADLNMLTTVVRNLLSNALKFTSKGGKVNINCIEYEDKIETSIRDTGIGLSSKEQNRLFKIDENFSKAGTNNEHGTGLGLILCKEFIEKNQGKIWVKSQVNKGSDFRFVLPKSKK